ncbi:GAF and ANTAR domain-containing protein [Streptomyces violascens]|uniref:GAF and ANTAR domain-containing protein n=1 Tax=Streptomyces violascens TaxID=67381 RepID=UPI003693A1B4
MTFPLQAHLEAAASLLALADPAPQADDDCLLQQLARAAMHTPGMTATSCSLTGPQSPTAHIAASDEGAARMERLQYELAEGPCRDTLRTSKPLANILLGHPQSRTRWPRFSHHALNAGLPAITTLPIHVDDDVAGTLNLYHQPGALRPADIKWAQLLIQPTVIGLRHRHALEHVLHRNEQLQNALDTRVLIEQAKGILAERFDCSPTDAFTLLRDHARRLHLKVTALAAQIVNNPPATGPFSAHEGRYAAEVPPPDSTRRPNWRPNSRVRRAATRTGCRSVGVGAGARSRPGRHTQYGDHRPDNQAPSQSSSPPRAASPHEPSASLTHCGTSFTRSGWSTPRRSRTSLREVGGDALRRTMRHPLRRECPASFTTPPLIR